MTYSVLQQAAETRRSIYALNNTLPLSNEEVSKIIEHAVLHTPSSFNSQSARVVVLFGKEHAKVWHFVEEALRAVVPAEQFEATAQKLNLFKAGAATVLFFEDQDIVKGLQEQFPSYAANFPIWADQANAMVQYAVWTTLAAAGVGANLQHYNPLPDAVIAKEWNLPESWLLRAQMVIGGIAASAGEKAFQPIEGRLKVFGLKGAFYEQDFRFSTDLSADITERAREYKRDSAERYQTARAKLDTAVTARREQFSRKYPNRAGEIDKKYRENVSLADPNRLDDISLDSHNRRRFDVAGEERLSRDDRMAKFSRDSQRAEWGDQAINLQNGERDKALCSSGQGFYQLNVGREPESNRNPRNQETGEKINGDRTRTTLRENLENLARTARNRASEIIERIRELASRKRLDHSTVQRNQRAINDITEFNKQLETVISQRKRQSRGMSR